jgi:hypothetical protein
MSNLPAKVPKQTWEEMYSQLEEYREEHGDCLVKEEGSKLGRWVNTQRTRKKHSDLNPRQMRDLERLGFHWVVRPYSIGKRTTWAEMYSELEEYREENGDCLLNQGTKLGRWVNKQRTRKKSGDLYPWQIQDLDRLGFQWVVTRSHSLGKRTAWDAMYSQLEDYREEHGDCLVIQRCKLGRWVHNQRNRKKWGDLRPERIRDLDRLGFQWIGKSPEHLSGERVASTPSKKKKEEAPAPDTVPKAATATGGAVPCSNTTSPPFAYRYEDALCGRGMNAEQIAQSMIRQHPPGSADAVYLGMWYGLGYEPGVSSPPSTFGEVKGSFKNL